MPLYDYLCEACGRTSEVLQRFADPPLESCPHCGGKVKKQPSAPAFHLKGSGWYATDYAKIKDFAKFPELVFLNKFWWIPPTMLGFGVWLALASLGSVVLLAVSNHLTQNVSSIPLLWVVPLAIYLLTFILCFEGTRWYRRDAYLGFLVWILCVMAWFLADSYQALRLVL